MEFPEKTSPCRVENQQTQPTFDPGSWNRTRATLVGGECSHHCAIPAPKEHKNALTKFFCTQISMQNLKSKPKTK